MLDLDTLLPSKLRTSGKSPAKKALYGEESRSITEEFTFEEIPLLEETVLSKEESQAHFAHHAEERRGYTIVLDDVSRQQTSASSYMSASNHAANPASSTYKQERVVYQETLLPGFGVDPMDDPSTPLRIREMLALYEHGDGSFEQKCKSFYVQGKFMEDYEDDAPWQGSLCKYFPTYHSLNIRQLRGYFTWRTYVRKGHYFPISASLAYLYLYELLNGIGVASAEESLQLMDEFEREFINAGLGNETMRENLHKWAFELSILKGLPPDAIESHLGKELLEADRALCALRDPESFSDSEVYAALVSFLEKKQTVPPVIKKDEARGKHLFAQVWRFALRQANERGESLLEELFGKRKAYSWHPLANAIYFSEAPHPDCEYELNPCHRLVCKNGSWKEERYENLYFNKEKLRAFFRGTDRILRERFKTGHYLLAKPEELWVAPLVDAVLEEEERQRIEASRPKITIDVSCLDQIRSDAIQTRDSLIVDEAEDVELARAAGGFVQEEDREAERGRNGEAEEGAEFHGGGSRKASEIRIEEDPDGRATQASNKMPRSISQISMLDSLQFQVLERAMEGESASTFLKEQHLIPSVVVDAINEALFDEIGDSVLECDGSEITFVEDYREDIESLLEG